MSTSEQLSPLSTTAKTNGWKVFGITIIVLASIIIGGWLVSHFLFPSQFTPVSLSASETQILNQKLDILNLPLLNENADITNKVVTPLTPEAYTEADANREVTFTEREINAMIANNTDMADKLAIDLSSDLASAKLLMPLDPDMPLLGGKILRLQAGIELAFGKGQPIVKLRGVSAWGVPIPNAWLGNLKNIDLVHKFGAEGGFWQSFADGIDHIKVSDGTVIVTLKQ
jgi:hypothetical protein